MNMDIFNVNKRVLIVAEIGNNHEGSYTLAEELIGLAAEAGVDAVKFQTFNTDLYVSKKDEARYTRLKKFELKYGDFEKLRKFAAQQNLLFISTPFDIESAAFLREIVFSYKVSSGDNNFYPLMEFIAKTGKPIIMSGGLSNIQELKYSKALIDKIWSDEEIAGSLAILHCVSCYPVPLSETNLRAIAVLKNELQCTVGYSDHTLGIEAAVLAVALGASIIEKHFTKDKNYSSFRDHQLSADPVEMKVMVEKIRQAETLLGSYSKDIMPSEKQNLPLIRRSIVAKRDLKRGHRLSFDDITWIRTTPGLAAGKENLVIGKALHYDVQCGDLITQEMLK